MTTQETAAESLVRRAAWPGSASLSAAALDMLGRNVTRGRLRVLGTDGAVRVYEGTSPGPEAELRVVRDRAVWRLLAHGANGLGDSYVDGDWESPDVATVLEFGILNQSACDRPGWGARALRLADRLRFVAQGNSRRGSRRNIAAHYDLGNAFFGLWLDPGMTYSSALFERPGQDLPSAQDAKYARLCDARGLAPGHRVLEIGCGWGGFAEFAATRHGCHVTGITLSREQFDHALRRVRDAGIADRVEIRLQDYRDVPGTFDRVASIEMFEAVGERYWPAFFETLRARLVPGGRVALQVITIDEARFDAYRREPDFIQTRVFPGGMLPTVAILRDRARAAGLRPEAAFMFGRHYEETLVRWRQAFLARWPEAAALGFDDRFRRLWSFYLDYCIAGFRTGQTDVGHFAFGAPS
jgi:cyclopropane-fatty-acyl-phospholipid synthase